MPPSKKQVTGVALASIAAVATAAGAQAASGGPVARTIERGYSGHFDGDPNSHLDMFVKGTAASGSVFVKISGVRIRCGAMKERQSFSDNGGYGADHKFNYDIDNGTTAIRFRGSFAGSHAHGSIKVDTSGCEAPQPLWDAHT
jgi:hypothetical protein